MGMFTKMALTLVCNTLSTFFHFYTFDIFRGLQYKRACFSKQIHEYVLVFLNKYMSMLSADLKCTLIQGALF